MSTFPMHHIFLYIILPIFFFLNFSFSHFLAYTQALKFLKIIMQSKLVFPSTSSYKSIFIFFYFKRLGIEIFIYILIRCMIPISHLKHADLISKKAIKYFLDIQGVSLQGVSIFLRKG